MAIYQCEYCGCVESTNTSSGHKIKDTANVDWSKHQNKKGKILCSSCSPTHLKDGTPTGEGQWHNEFPQRYLKIGEWETNSDGNLEHKKLKETNYLSHTSTSPYKQKLNLPCVNSKKSHART